MARENARTKKGKKAKPEVEIRYLTSQQVDDSIEEVLKRHAETFRRLADA